MIVVVIGVSGSGKSTIGTRLARALAGEFLEGDELHSPANIEKMSRGLPLNDDDRAPWLAAVHARIVDASRRGASLVVACSALKQAYRNVLGHGVAITWVYLKGSKDLLRQRLRQRASHFMKAGMLDSQFDALEEPSTAIVVDVAAAPEVIVAGIVARLSPAELRVLPDVASLSAAAAAAAAATIQAAVTAHGGCSVALSGGETPRGLYRLLGSQFRDQISWERVHFFWGDERYVPADHPDSNYRMARETLLDHVPCPASNIHPMPTQVVPAEQAAAAYERELRDHFGAAAGPAFDLNILGIGEDGHTASVFPGSAAVDERRRWVVAVHTGGSPEWRLTLTLGALSQSTTIYVLVAGAAKAPALRRSRAADADPHSFPAAGIRATGSMVWWADRAAAEPR